MFNRQQPYNDLPPLPPKADVESRAVLRAVTIASRSLAELKGRTNTIPNPKILLNTISLQEARSSSEIENIWTTNDELYRGLSLDELGLSPEQKEVLHYNDALWTATAALRERPFLSTDLFVEIVNAIKGNNSGLRRIPGTRIVNPSTKQVVYTPPEGEEVIHRLLQDLEAFANRDDDGLDPLVKMAIIHYQFEAIHPFHDGNGRAGRIVLILYLLLQRLLDQPILFVSRYIIEHKSDYYRHLREVTEEGAWEPWILYLLKAVEITAAATSQKIEAIEQLLKAMTEEARQKLPPRMFKKELVELIFEQPYCRISNLEEAGIGGIAQRVTASKYLNTMAKVGLVEVQKVGREVIFMNTRLVDLLSGSL